MLGFSFSVLVAGSLTTLEAADGYRVQIGAFRTEQEAIECWARFSAANPDLLESLAPRVEKADLGLPSGVFHRLQVGRFGSRSAADVLCRSLKARAVSCFIVHSTKQESSLRNSEFSSRVEALESQLLELRVDASEQKARELEQNRGGGGGGSRISPTPRPSKTPAVATNGSPLAVAEPTPNPTSPSLASSSPNGAGAAKLGRSADTARRGHVLALGGIAFEPSAGCAGAGLAIHLARDLLVTVEVGRIWNVRSDSLKILDVEFAAQTPVIYAIAGPRVRVPASSWASPYFTMGAGVGWLKRETQVKVGERDFTADFRVVGFDLEGPARTEIVFELGAGINLGRARGFSLDVGYRFLRIGNADAINVSRAYVGAGYSF